MGIERPILTIDAPVGATVHLPADFAIVPCIDEHAWDIVLSSIQEGTTLHFLKIFEQGSMMKRGLGMSTKS